MMIFTEIEVLLYAVSRVFLAPVMALIAAALAYVLAMLGGFAIEAWQRRRGVHRRELFAYAAGHVRRRGGETGGAGENTLRAMTSDDLELWIMKRLEWLRIVSRAAPMLGLIATMIPMGPALLALGSSDGAAVGRSMVAAFSAVILALLSASIAFFILTVRRRWLLQDLRLWEQQEPASRAGGE